MNNSTPSALTIAGSDPSGGAGLQADLKTFQAHSVYGMCVVTLITAQNTAGVSKVELLTPELISQQLESVLRNIPPSVIKTGALGSASIIELVSSYLATQVSPIVVDPVMVSKHGHSLAEDSAVTALKRHLLPIATIITPNRFEAEQLTGVKIDSIASALVACKSLHDSGAAEVVLKMGCFEGEQFLIHSMRDRYEIYRKPHLDTRSLHGTGCVLSALLTSHLALGNTSLQAVATAIDSLHNAIRFAPSLGEAFKNGSGFGPVGTTHFKSVANR